MNVLPWRLLLAFPILASCSSSDDDKGTNQQTIGDTCEHTTTDDPSRRDSDTLPAGACDESEPVCELVVREPCPCLNIQVPRKFYSCTCDTGIWSCAVTSQDGGYCNASIAICAEDGGT